jgi:hypothetical protein
MPNDDVEGAINARLTELKERARRNLAAVRRAQAAAPKVGLLDVYRGAVNTNSRLSRSSRRWKPMRHMTSSDHEWKIACAGCVRC